MTYSRLKYDPEKCNSFRIGCDMGDQVYGLMFAKKMGTKALYLDGEGAVYNGRDGKDYIVAWECKFNWEKAEFLLPLFKHQSYVETAELYSAQEYDINYGEWDVAVPVGWGTNLVDFHGCKFDLEIEDLNDAWLEAPKITEGPYKDAQIVINRTPRHQGNPDFFKGLNHMGIPERVVFVGLPDEYQEFISEFNFTCSYFPSKDALEMAAMINTAPIFMGNQSLACSIAIGLGKTCFVEEGRASANYIFHGRNNIFYV